MVIKHEPHHTDIDKWTGVSDDDYCYDCSKWIEATHEDKCPICETPLDYDDRFTTASTAKVAIKDSPVISSTGDMWNRSSSYSWGGGGWWQGQSTGSTSSMWGSWGSSHADKDDATRLLKHKRHLDSLCKVVDPTVSHKLDYNYEGQNYSDLERGLIRIDGSLLKKSDDNLDITAGLAIHEKLHLIHSKPLYRWEKRKATELVKDTYEGTLLHTIANSVEDEYIEKQLAKDNAGFVTYISEVKKHFFKEKMETKLEMIEDNPFMDILNTLLAFIRWPEHMGDTRRKRHGKHIRFFARALKNGLDSRENTFECIEALFHYLKAVAEKMVKDKGSGEDMKKDIEKEMDKLKKSMTDGDLLTDEQWESIKDSIKKDIERKRSRMSDVRKLMKDSDGMRELEEAVDYTLDAKSSALADEISKEIEELEDSDYMETEMTEVGLIYKNQKKITWRKARPTEGQRVKYKAESKNMKKISNSLKRKIDLYGNTQKHTIRNQKRGKIDKRMLHRIPLGRKDLFKNDIIEDDKPLDICILVDESGSMGSWKMEMARQSAIATKEALQDNPKLDLWVFGHTADGEAGWHTDCGSTNMTEYWGPNMKDRPMAMGAMIARYENRDGMAIWAAAERVSKESSQPMSNKLMIIYSDGQPAASGYGGYDGMSHVRKVVNHLEGKGWSIIQVGISGADKYAQQKMFNNHIMVSNIDNLAPAVSKIIRRVIKV